MGFPAILPKKVSVSELVTFVRSNVDFRSITDIQLLDDPIFMGWQGLWKGNILATPSEVSSTPIISIDGVSRPTRAAEFLFQNIDIHMNTPHALKALRVISLVVAIFCSFPTNAQTCEKPVIKNNLSLNALSGADFKLEWAPVANARHYELKYIVRIPDGRTLLQSEVTESNSFHTFSEHEFPQGDLLQLIVEISTQCEEGKSLSSFAQMAFVNRRDGCQFKNTMPILKAGNLAWDPVAKAQSYLMCFFGGHHEASCQETTSIKNDITVGDVNLLAVTPICNAVPGTTTFVSVAQR